MSQTLSPDDPSPPKSAPSKSKRSSRDKQLNNDDVVVEHDGTADSAKMGNVDYLSESEVFDNELELLKERRQNVGLHHAASDKKSEDLRDSLVGLSLSGGGLRSGAYSLGILQGLWKKGLLPAIDYLSTVSGGGYAGAFLSSHGLNSKQAGVDDDPTREGSKGFAIAPGQGGRHTTRMNRFVNQGNYLFNSTGQFLNRHTIGLLLIWILCISGLCAAAAGLAFCYRQLDHDLSRAWLEALGADGEVKLAFFPTMVLLGLWIVLWGCSFFAWRRRATGHYAKYVFYMLLFSVAAATAVLLGTGEVYMASAANAFGLIPNMSDAVTTWGHHLTMLLIPVILAALLPYMKPKKLLESGTSPNASTIEKYTFRFATRALVYGVPFLFITYFAQENISGWDERRDDRLQRLDITPKGWSASSPIWRQAWEENLKETDVLAREPFAGFLWNSKVPQDQATRSILKGIRDGLSMREKALGTRKLVEITDQIDAEFKKEDSATQASLLERLRLIKSRNSTFGIAEPRIERKLATQPMRATLAQQGELRDQRLSLLRRWAYFLSFCFDSFGSNQGAEGNNPVVNHKEALMASINTKKVVVDELNTRLAEKDFCRVFLPDEKLRSFYYAVGSNFKSAFPKARLSEYQLWPPGKKSEGNYGERKSETIGFTAQRRTFARKILLEVLRPVRLFWGKLSNNGEIDEHTGDRRKKKVDSIVNSYEQLFLEFEVLHNYASSLDKKQQLQTRAEKNKVTDEFRQWTSNVLNAYVKARLTAQSMQHHHQSNFLSAQKDFRLDSVQKELAHEKLLSANRALLKAYYGNLIRGKHDKLYSYVVLNKDQEKRLKCLVYSALVCLITGLCLNLNVISWHGFYSRQLANMWIEPHGELEYDIPLAQVVSHKSGWPYHLMNGTVQPLDPLGRNHCEKPSGNLPKEDFLLSYKYCGSQRLGFTPTSKYMGGKVLLEDAVAISGGAVSPIASRNPLVLILLFLGNVRLGQWLDNPALSSWSMPSWLRKFRQTWPVTPLRILVNLWKKSSKRPFCFVSDGGHGENLGVAPLLKRRCKLIITCDAGQDRKYELFDLAKVVRWARTQEGITIAPIESDERDSSFDPCQKLLGIEWSDRLQQRKSDDAIESTPTLHKHGFIAKIHYPATDRLPASEGHFIYLKASVTGDESLDVMEYYQRNPAFPHEATSDQMFDPDRFESYRALGEHTIDSVFPSEPISIQNFRGLPASPVDAYIDHFVAEMKKASKVARQTKGLSEPEIDEAENVQENAFTEDDESML